MVEDILNMGKRARSPVPAATIKAKVDADKHALNAKGSEGALAFP